jgi:hypothetical protein
MSAGVVPKRQAGQRASTDDRMMPFGVRGWTMKTSSPWRCSNRETSGSGGGYDLCSRCGREKKSYEERGNPSFGGSLPGGPPL